INTSFVGNLSEIFLLFALRRTADRILVQATKTAAKRSLNQAHLSAILSVCCLDIALDQLGTSFSNFWNMMRILRPFESLTASLYISSKTLIIGGHIMRHNCSRYSFLASTSTFKLSIYD